MDDRNSGWVGREGVERRAKGRKVVGFNGRLNLPPLHEIFGMPLASVVYIPDHNVSQCNVNKRTVDNL